MSISAAVMGAAKLALTATTSILGIVGAKQSFDAQQQQVEDNAEAAKDAYILETHLINKRKREELDKAAVAKMDNNLKSQQGAATAQTAASASGTIGRSVEQTLAKFKRNEGLVSSRIDDNAERVTDQLQFNVQAAASKANSRINSVPSLRRGALRIYGTGHRQLGRGPE